MACLATVTGFAANVSSTVLSGLWNKVVEAVKMVISLPQAVTDMEAEVQRLKDVRDNINADLAREQSDKPKTIVNNWLEKAGRAIDSSVSINNEYQEHRNCLACCPNCVCRYRISRRIRDLILHIDRLHLEKQSDIPQSGQYGDPTPSTQIPIRNPKFVGDGIQSAQSELERLLTEDTDIQVVGVYGMGGIGKTSLLQAINNSHKVRESFQVIIWVTVSKDHDILKMQNCIGERLKINNFKEISNFEQRKYVLYSKLKDMKFILILDDIWRAVELESLGVSLHDTPSKILLSTRSRVVCTQMKAGVIRSVEPLSEEEGWQLFCSRAFLNGNAPHEIEDVARKIAGECKGLPLAINVVAAAMTEHGTDLHLWEVAFLQMQKIGRTFDDLHPQVDEQLFQRLKWSYDALKSDHLKICFLYFAAYPEDSQIWISDVTDMWISESLVEGNGMSYLLDTVHSYINHLRDRCLIEVVRTDEVGRISCVKIHDVLRDLAIRIAEKDHRCYFKAGQGVTDFPSEEDSEGCARMSLMYNHLHSLPTTFAFSSLSVLLLRENRGIEEVPESFLRELSSLKVLDLSHTGITSLPPSIGNLKHLASLQLESTGICELPESICDLKELQFLNVKFCDKLLCLPEKIRELKRLRALDIGVCFELSHLPRGISELVSLERLSMLHSGISLHFEGDANAERKNACFKDLQSLCGLRVLSVCLKSAVKERVMGNWSKMRDLSLSFDDDVNQDELPQDMQAMKDLERFEINGCDVERLPSCLTQFRKLAYLYLESCKQLKELPAELPCLRELHISNCHKLLEELELGMGFPKLEKLSLYRLESLECVGAGEGAAASGSGGLGEGASLLPMLKTLQVLSCPKLKRLRGGWDKLKCLESIAGDSREWWDSIQCDDPSIKTSLQSKFEVNKLKRLEEELKRLQSAGWWDAIQAIPNVTSE